MISRIFFGLIAAAILIGITYFTAKIYGIGFRFNGQTTKLTFLVFLLIPFIFVASILTSRSATWGIGPTLYTLIQILAGVGLYVFIGALVLGIILLIAFLVHIQLPIIIVWIIFIASLALALTGLIQSRYIVVREYTVVLSNAPDSWNTKTAALVADTHFGLVNHKEFSDKVVAKILSLNPDFVLHAGDFYDGPSVPTLPITDSWKNLVAQKPVFYAPGNHEEYGDYAGFLSSIKTAGITALVDESTEYDGVIIAGIRYRSGKDNADAANAIAKLNLDAHKSTILINHPPTSLRAAANKNIDLQVSGHTHNGQFWPMNYLIRKIYGTYAYGLNQYQHMQVLTTSGVGTFGPPFRLFNSPEIVLIHFKTK
jgi:uncharacterized protein